MFNPKRVRGIVDTAGRKSSFEADIKGALAEMDLSTSTAPANITSDKQTIVFICNFPMWAANCPAASPRDERILTNSPPQTSNAQPKGISVCNMT
jgi:hypothetical protein